jgi:hypothetical protein
VVRQSGVPELLDEPADLDELAGSFLRPAFGFVQADGEKLPRVQREPFFRMTLIDGIVA